MSNAPGISTSIRGLIGNRSILYPLLIALVVLVLGAKDLTREGSVSLQGDMPRYLMNGVYFHDLLRDLPFKEPLEYTYRYFARYPALSLGHHPVLLPLIEAPFFALFGISVTSARLSILLFSVLAAMCWYFLVRSIYDASVAFYSSLLFATAPFIVRFTRVVMSEIPALALALLATFLFQQYCSKGTRGYALAVWIVLPLSIYAKHTSIFLIPVFLLYLLLTKGLVSIANRKMLLSSALLVLLLVPLAGVTFHLAKGNIAWITQQPLSSRITASNLLYYPSVLWDLQLTIPVFLMALAGFAVSVALRDRRVILFVLLIIFLYLQVTYIGAADPRYAINWVPAFCLLAVVPLYHLKGRARMLLSALLVGVTLYQSAVSLAAEPDRAEGYEEAARYISSTREGSIVLYSARVDSGYFVFFARKHDPGKDVIVLLADKMLVSSSMQEIVEEKITERVEIYELLRNCGIRYVVIEGDRFDSPPLQWLNEEVATGPFNLEKEIPLRSNSEKLRDVSLRIYEYTEHTLPRRGELLQLRISPMGESISVPLDDLLLKK